MPSDDPYQHEDGKEHITQSRAAHVLGQLGEAKANVCRVHQQQDRETHIVEARDIGATNKQERHEVMREHLPVVRTALLEMNNKHLMDVIACFPQIHCLAERIHRCDRVSQP